MSFSLDKKLPLGRDGSMLYHTKSIPAMPRSLQLPQVYSHSDLSCTDGNPELIVKDDIYVHQELDKSTGKICLLRRNDTKSETTWSLEHWNLADTPPYRALSYSWGAKDETETIIIDGRKLCIRQNLYQIL
jgi:hypothetical protein